jgi:outer membrane protein OmpA-like peptidoglycan-associated protein
MSVRFSLLTGASLMLAAAVAVPQARAQFYIGGEGGWTGLEGTKSNITGTNPITGGAVNIPINNSFDSGFNVGARAGYQFGPWRVEGEYSYRQNGSNGTALGARVNGTVDTNSLMVNGIYDFNLGWPVSPHLGFGLGGASVNGNLSGPNVGYHSKTSDVVFAYQAIAGVRYMMSPNLALDVDYRYRGSADETYTTSAFTTPGGVTVPGHKFSGSANTNNVVASLTWLFNEPRPAPPPMAAAVPAPPPPPAAQVFIVFFDWDKDTVTSQGMQIVQRAAAEYKSGRAVRLQVTGYTDRSGSPGYNQRLSERRATNVARALAGMGVPQDQMTVSGKGENGNRVPTANGVREPQNRRVEIAS